MVIGALRVRNLTTLVESPSALMISSRSDWLRLRIFLAKSCAFCMEALDLSAADFFRQSSLTEVRVCCVRLIISCDRD